MNKALGNTTIFVSAYLIFMGLNYYLSSLGSTAFEVQHLDDASLSGLSVSILPSLFQISAILMLLWISLERGINIGKKWIVLLPIVAFAFDFIPKLSDIPMVPSVYHLLAIVVGVASPVISTLNEVKQ